MSPEIIIPLVSIPVVLVVIVLVLRSLNKRSTKRKESMEALHHHWTTNGFATTATIVETEYFGPVGGTVQTESAEMYKLTVEYKDQSGKVQRADKDEGRKTYCGDSSSFYDKLFFISKEASYRLKKSGNEIPVIVHPDDPSQIYFDRDKLEDEENELRQKLLDQQH